MHFEDQEEASILENLKRPLIIALFTFFWQKEYNNTLCY